MESARRQVTVLDDAVTYNRQTLDSYMKQFNVGQRTLPDVPDARNELFQTSGLPVTARTNEAIAKARLLALAGKLNAGLGINKEVYRVKAED